MSSVANMFFAIIVHLDTVIPYALSTLLVLGVGWAVKRLGDLIKFARQAYEKLVHLDDCMDDVKKASAADREAVRVHRQEAESRDKRISELEKDYAGLEGWAKGIFNKPIDAKLTEIHPNLTEAPP